MAVDAGRRRRMFLVAAGAIGGAVLISAMTADGSSPAGAPAELRTVQVATTGNDSELVQTLPITPSRGAAKRVVMSMPPGTLPGLLPGDLLRLTAELQITTNCGLPSARCVGPIYNYAPTIDARLILAPSPQTTGGPDAFPVSHTQAHRCSGPEAEHHCVTVFTHAGLAIGHPARLPCPLDACYVNLVADAHNARAGPGEVVMVGGDRPDGTIPQDRGRINAVRYRGASASDFGVAQSRQAASQAIPPDLQRRVVFSQRLDALSRGEQLAVSAWMLTDVAGVPYNVRTSARLILAGSPTGTTPGPIAAHVATLGGEISENNGFNCTQAMRTCLVRKVGVLEIRRDAIGATGAPIPLYVNLVAVLGPKELRAHPADRVLVRGGGISVTRIPPATAGASW